MNGPVIHRQQIQRILVLLAGLIVGSRVPSGRCRRWLHNHRLRGRLIGNDQYLRVGRRIRRSAVVRACIAWITGAVAIVAAIAVIAAVPKRTAVAAVKAPIVERVAEIAPIAVISAKTANAAVSAAVSASISAAAAKATTAAASETSTG